MRADVVVPAGEALAKMEHLLDQIDDSRGGVEASTRLAWVRLARRVRSRVDALTSLLVAEADQAGAAERTVGTPLVSWLGMGETLSRAEAAGVVRQARSVAQHPLAAEAATAGMVGGGQLRAITTVLDTLSPQLSQEQQDRAEQVMVDLASQLDAAQLAKSAGRVLAEVAPVDAGELLEIKLQREVEAARQSRSLRFRREGASYRFDGSLPRVEAETWLAQLDAQAEALRRGAVQTRDRLTETTTFEQRRADALVALIHATSRAKPVPGVGVAKMIVKLDYDRLLEQATGAGLIGAEEQLSAGELRRLCCEAELIPAVLGSDSEVLDVGRASRLATPAIRTALTQRDGGCVFPGCDIRPGLCDAHHIKPWWAAGTTSLANLVLLCHTHHGLIEPAKFGVRDQWSVRIAEDGRPEFTPPRRYDPERKPIRHHRHFGDCRGGGASDSVGVSNRARDQLEPDPVFTTTKPTEQLRQGHHVRDGSPPPVAPVGAKPEFVPAIRAVVNPSLVRDRAGPGRS